MEESGRAKGSEEWLMGECAMAGIKDKVKQVIKQGIGKSRVLAKGDFSV